MTNGQRPTNAQKKKQGIDMRHKLTIVMAALALWVLSASPTEAQAYKSSAGWSGGVLINTGLNDGATGADLVDMKPDPTWLMSIHFDQWFGRGNVGVRARGGMSKPSLPWVQGDREIRVLMADLGLLLRPIAPGPGRSTLPFISGGVGLINWGLGDGPATVYAPAAVAYTGEEGIDFVATASLGVDIVTPWVWGEGPLVIRLEARDHIQFSSPFDPSNSEDPEFGMIHNAALVLGFHTGIGLLNRGQ